MAPQGRMRGEFAAIARSRVAVAHLPLISQRAGPLTASPERGKPLAIYGSSAVNVVNSASVSKSYTFTVRLWQFSGTAAK